MKNVLFCLLVAAVAMICVCGCSDSTLGGWRPQPSIGINRATGQILIAGSTNDKGYLGVYDLSKRKLKILFTDPDWIGDPAVSPDGKVMVFSKVVDTTGVTHLFSSKADGTGQRQLTFGHVADSQSVFSNDGKHVYFTRSATKQMTSMGGVKWYDWDLFDVKLSDSKVSGLTSLRAYSMGRVGVMKEGGIVTTYEDYDDKTSAITYPGIIVSHGHISPIKGLDSPEACPSPFDDSIYYCSADYSPEICVWHAGKPVRQLTKLDLYVSDIIPLDGERFVALVTPHRDLSKYNSPTGVRDVRPAIYLIDPHHKRAEELVSIEELQEPVELPHAN